MAKNLLNKYVWLVETIYRARKITFKEINQRWLDNDLSEGVDLNDRTFHRWRDACEELFGINIDCEKNGTHRYYIDNEEEIKRGGLRSWLLDTISVSNLLLENQSLKDRIILEKIPSGKDYLSPILDAMKRNRLIHILYYSYYRDDERQHYVMPLCVKLFRQRWYMVGKTWSNGNIAIYCLDRIRDFRLSSHTFEFPDDFDPEVFFEDYFGVIAEEKVKTELVSLKVAHRQANYIRDLPLHDSQIEVVRNADYSIFELHIKPTFDFKQEILWNGDDIEVLKPVWLRKEIAGKAKRIWDKYDETDHEVRPICDDTYFSEEDEYNI